MRRRYPNVWLGSWFGTRRFAAPRERSGKRSRGADRSPDGSEDDMTMTHLHRKKSAIAASFALVAVGAAAFVVWLDPAAARREPQVRAVAETALGDARPGDAPVLARL